jgi:hypothetical protein
MGTDGAEAQAARLRAHEGSTAQDGSSGLPRDAQAAANRHGAERSHTQNGKKGFAPLL